MPRVLIEVRHQYTREQETVLIDKVFEGLRDAFALPESDRNLRLVVHEPHRFSCPPDRAQPELYTHITIDAFAGRQLDLALNRPNVIHAALLAGPASETVLARCRRLERFRTGDPPHTATDAAPDLAGKERDRV